MSKWYSLPLWVQQLMLDRQEQQGNARSARPFVNWLLAGRSTAGFTWDETPEGRVVWSQALELNNFEPLAEKNIGDFEDKESISW